LNVVFSWVPSPLTTAMIAIEIPAGYEAVFDRGSAMFVFQKRDKLRHSAHSLITTAW